MAILLNSCYDIFHSISYIIVKVAVCYYWVQCNSIDYVRERCPQIKKKHNTYMNIFARWRNSCFYTFRDNTIFSDTTLLINVSRKSPFMSNVVFMGFRLYIAFIHINRTVYIWWSCKHIMWQVCLVVQSGVQCVVHLATCTNIFVPTPNAI